MGTKTNLKDHPKPMERTDEAELPALPPDLPEGVRVCEGQLFYRGVPVSELQAYPLAIARLILGISGVTLWREIRMNRIRTTPLKLIPRKELERYLDEEARVSFKPVRRKRHIFRVRTAKTD